MKIHDHFDGSAHCVECRGFCQLRGDDRALTDLVRFTCDFFGYAHDGWMPNWVEQSLQELLGERWPNFRRRSIDGMRAMKKVMAHRA